MTALFSGKQQVKRPQTAVPKLLSHALTTSSWQGTPPVGHPLPSCRFLQSQCYIKQYITILIFHSYITILIFHSYITIFIFHTYITILKQCNPVFCKVFLPYLTLYVHVHLECCTYVAKSVPSAYFLPITWNGIPPPPPPPTMKSSSQTSTNYTCKWLLHLNLVQGPLWVCAALACLQPLLQFMMVSMHLGQN